MLRINLTQALLASSGLLLAATTFGGLFDLKMTEIGPSSDAVEITHCSTGTFTTAANHPFCHRFNYSSFIPASTTFTGGQSRIFAVTGLDDADSDIWLYNAGNFSTPGDMITGMKYGAETNIGRTEIAVAAGLWPHLSDFVPTPTAGLTAQLVTLDPTASLNWQNRVNTPNAFFGTGIPVTAGIPDIPKGSKTIGLACIANGLNSPLGVVAPHDPSGRLFIFDQTGTVHTWKDGALATQLFMNVTGRLVTLSAGFDERGLIGFALDQNFTSNGLVYTYTSEPASGTPDFNVSMPGAPDHHGVIAAWAIDTMSPNKINPTSRRELLRFASPQFNHNGGALILDTNNYLYIAIGDGGGSNDNGSGHGSKGNGQDLGTVLGTILRIDPNGNNSANGEYGVPPDNPFVGISGAIEEIYAYGLRNPYRISFDTTTYELYVGDVGQGQIEEIDIVTAGDNLGWRLLEGTFFFDQASGGLVSIPVGPLPNDLVYPVAQYDHGDGVSVIGGHVYRGKALPELSGNYIFAEFRKGASGRLLCMPPDHNLEEFVIGTDDRPLNFLAKGMGEDQSGEVYITGSASASPFGGSGKVYKIIPLASITDLAQTASNCRVTALLDDSITGAVLQASTHLSPTATTWTIKASPLNVITGNHYEITFPNPSSSPEFYRIQHP